LRRESVGAIRGSRMVPFSTTATMAPLAAAKASGWSLTC